MYKYFVNIKDGSYELVDTQNIEEMKKYKDNPNYYEMFVWVD